MEKIYASLIHRIGKRLFGDRPSPIGEVLPVFREEIPRYPPFMKGLPAVSPEKLLETQAELIERIANTAIALPAQIERYYLSAIKRFARFAHLLPASQSHHHRGAGNGGARGSGSGRARGGVARGRGA